jgi:hypothetical protein
MIIIVSRKSKNINEYLVLDIKGKLRPWGSLLLRVKLGIGAFPPWIKILPSCYMN